jgi:hypothetical protein
LFETKNDETTITPHHPTKEEEKNAGQLIKNLNK